MKCIARRVSDKAVLHLVKLWLDAPVEETDERGRTQQTTRNKDEGRGSPQGAPISPLLANLYMRRFVLTVNEAKTRVCKLPADSFDFLGYTIGMYWSWKQQRMVLSTRPSAKAVKRLKAKISEATRKNMTLLDV